MLTLFSYPSLFGVADNNPFGLKAYAFLKLSGLAFRHEHIFDAKDAPRRQLPYLADGAEHIGDSDTIISVLTARYGVVMDRGLTQRQRDTGLLVGRTLDDLYWVMSYSRWKDEHFWPSFAAAFLQAYPGVTQAALDTARQYNFKRYDYQGIGRYEPAAAYARGIADLDVLARLLPPAGFLFGPAPCSIDAALYGFVANIYYFQIATPLRAAVLSHPGLVAHCEAVHAMLGD